MSLLQSGRTPTIPGISFLSSLRISYGSLSLYFSGGGRTVIALPRGGFIIDKGRRVSGDISLSKLARGFRSVYGLYTLNLFLDRAKAIENLFK